MDYHFTTTRTNNPKVKPDPSTLEFGKTFTDHMFVMDYTREKGWHDGRVVPFAPLEVSPAAVVFHYGQASFEGLKAYKTVDGKIALFRPEKNAQRINTSNDRLCMPMLDEDMVVEAIKYFVAADKDWVPSEEGTSLYIRPFVIATEAFLGVRAANEFKFIIIASPVGAYYKGGLAPTKIYIEDNYVRAVVGGTGNTKVGGNYAASLKAQEEAHDKGYSQILWLDGVEKKYVEEIGTSNAFFVVAGEVLTASLTGSILPGITRDSVITLLKSWGIKITERKISMEEIAKAHKDGILDEVFASGTAAVISPVGELCWHENKMVVNNGEIGVISQRLYDAITGIQSGKVKDEFGWTKSL